MTMLTLERLKEVLDYDPRTGVFTRLTSRGRPDLVGSPAGFLDGDRVRIYVDGKVYMRSRLAWFFMHGKWPPEDVDHRNCAPSDDRAVNLRKANRSQNNANRRSTRFKGAHRVRKKWEARIVYNRKYIYLGLFDTPQEAHEAYKKVALQLHGEFFRAA